MKKLKQIKLNFIQIALIVLIPSVIMSILSGSLVYNRLSNSTGKVTTTNNKYVNEFIKAYNKLLDGYYEDLDENALIDSAIDGMMSYAGDDYTIYMNENATEQLNDKLDGTYKGIGVRIGLNDQNQICIYEVFDNSPAKNAGILPNDILTSINGESLEGKTVDEASKIIQNGESKSYNISVLRGEDQLEFVVDKTTLVVPAMTSSIKEVNGKRIGYMYLQTFSSTLNTQVNSTLLSMEKENIDSLIIDVRNNTGGYLSSCTNIIELFLAKNKVMYSIKSKKNQTVYKDETDEKRSYPIVVLVNENSASASDILAGALKYSYGATLVGTKTYGKGKVQNTDKLEDGTMIKYTSAKWLMPNGECIDQKGINPDINVELSEVYKDNPSEENDNQLNEALKILSQ